MAKQEITLKGLDGHEDHLLYDAADGQMNGSLEDCARSLFPADGETTPRLRFQGFEGEWEKKTIGDICYSQASSIAQDSLQSTEGKYPVYGASGFIQNIDFFQQDQPYVGVVKDGAGVGRVSLYPAYSSILGTLHYILPKKGYNITFIAYLLQTIDLTAFASGSTIPHIYFKDYAEKEIYVPSLEEQIAIASFFRRLDSQIALRKDQYERLQQLKSACLNSMFPRESQITPPHPL